MNKNDRMLYALNTKEKFRAWLIYKSQQESPSGIYHFAINVLDSENIEMPDLPDTDCYGFEVGFKPSYIKFHAATRVWDPENKFGWIETNKRVIAEYKVE